MTSDLITRLSKLEAPDREVDAQIYILFNIPAERAGRIDYSNGMVGWWPKDGPYVSAVTVPAYTASVEEAIALAKRVFDPAWIRIDEWYMGEDKPAVAAILPRPTPNETYGGKGANQAIAILIALLRAKEASNA